MSLSPSAKPLVSEKEGKTFDRHCLGLFPLANLDQVGSHGCLLRITPAEIRSFRDGRLGLRGIIYPL